MNNGFAFHNWWHLALFHLEAGNFARVLELYDRRIRATPSQVPLEMIDASALLWRLELRVGERRRPLAETGRVLGAVRRAFLLRVQRRACRDGVRRLPAASIWRSERSPRWSARPRARTRTR